MVKDKSFGGMPPPFRNFTRGERRGVGGMKCPYQHHERAHTIFKTKMRVYIYIYFFSIFMDREGYFLHNRWLISVSWPLATHNGPLYCHQSSPISRADYILLSDYIFIDYYITPYKDNLYQINYRHPNIIYIPVHYTFTQWQTIFQFIIYYPIRRSDHISDC